MDNQIYGLTKGQTFPSSAAGFVTKSTPQGAIEKTLSPMELAVTSGATGKKVLYPDGLTELLL